MASVEGNISSRRNEERELRSRKGKAVANTNDSSAPNEQQGDAVQRRVLRHRYLAVKKLITGEGQDLTGPDPDRFKSIIYEVESLHQHVHNPREQVADAEALFDITNVLVSSVKAQKNAGITPSDFVTCLLRDFGQHGRASTVSEDARNSILWKDIGLAVSHIFPRGAGCSTMLGPMNAELKQRKVSIRRNHVRPTESAHPEELEDNRQEKTDTDKNMSTMFNILKKNRRVRLENLVLNRDSFSQTVENLFALSFLVKDGRAEIVVDDKGYHLVSPRNAPASDAVRSGQVSYSHFVFRFDFNDWKLMMDSVEVGEELMPHRNQVGTSGSADAEPDSMPGHAGAAASTTPIRKLSRNRGLVLQEQTVIEDSPEQEHYFDGSTRSAAIRKGKRKL
ncbi:hypothetical protein Ancab_030941 [Ancistrocladus abbreviatus]